MSNQTTGKEPTMYESQKIAAMTAGAPRAPRCEHHTSTAARVDGDTIASVWECEECGHQRPFTDADYAFCNTRPWTAVRFGDRFRAAAAANA